MKQIHKIKGFLTVLATTTALSSGFAVTWETDGKIVLNGLEQKLVQEEKDSKDNDSLAKLKGQLEEKLGAELLYNDFVAILDFLNYGTDSDTTKKNKGKREKFLLFFKNEAFKGGFEDISKDRQKSIRSEYSKFIKKGSPYTLGQFKGKIEELLQTPISLESFQSILGGLGYKNEKGDFSHVISHSARAALSPASSLPELPSRGPVSLAPVEEKKPSDPDASEAIPLPVDPPEADVFDLPEAPVDAPVAPVGAPVLPFDASLPGLPVGKPLEVPPVDARPSGPPVGAPLAPPPVSTLPAALPPVSVRPIAPAKKWPKVTTDPAAPVSDPAAPVSDLPAAPPPVSVRPIAPVKKWPKVITDPAAPAEVKHVEQAAPIPQPTIPTQETPLPPPLADAQLQPPATTSDPASQLRGRAKVVADRLAMVAKEREAQQQDASKAPLKLTESQKRHMNRLLKDIGTLDLRKTENHHFVEDLAEEIKSVTQGRIEENEYASYLRNYSQTLMSGSPEHIGAQNVLSHF